MSEKVIVETEAGKTWCPGRSDDRQWYVVGDQLVPANDDSPIRGHWVDGSAAGTVVQRVLEEAVALKPGEKCRVRITVERVE